MFNFHLKSRFAILLGTTIFIMIAGCAVNNNSLHEKDLADCMALHGVKIEYIRPLESAILYADAGIEFGISDQRVAAYYFNTDMETQRNRIKNIQKNKFVFIMGLKFPAMVHGSYVLVNVNTNPQKHKIIAAFKKFEK